MNSSENFDYLTIAPRDIKAGDLILLGAKSLNQPVADEDAQVHKFGNHELVTILCDDGQTSLNMSNSFEVRVRRNRAFHEGA